MDRTTPRENVWEPVDLFEELGDGLAAFWAVHRPQVRSSLQHFGSILATASWAGTGWSALGTEPLQMPVSPGRATRGPTMTLTTDTDQIGSGRLLITYAEAARALSVSPRYLRSLVYQGTIPSVRLGARLRRITIEDLRAYVGALRGPIDASAWHRDEIRIVTGRALASRPRARTRGSRGGCTGVPEQAPAQRPAQDPERGPAQGPAGRPVQSSSPETGLDDEDGE
jgi:excisionase family DNA binding protein